MQLKGIGNLFVVAFGCLVIASMWSTYGCAGLGQPTGGPKDTLSPVLLRSVPENFTKQFKAKIVTFSFDEYVDLDNVSSKLLVNPPLERFPQVDRKLRTVTMRIKDTLDENTTYSFKFDGVIRDVNEGNPLGDFTYVLTTGTYFDTATVSGFVVDAQTGKVDSTLLVILHNNLSDTAVTTLKPRYVTRLDSSGFFRFEYLAPGSYNIFALKDEGFKRYSDSSVPFAFFDSVIQVDANTPPVELLVFVAKEREETKPEQPTEENEERKRRRNTDEDKKPLGLQPSATEQKPQDYFEDFTIQFNRPIAQFDSTLLFFSDTLFRPITNYTVTLDSTGNNLTLKHVWQLDTWYSLIFNKGFAADSAGISIAKTDTLRFKSKAESDYGSVKLTFSGLDVSTNPVLVWLKSGEIFKSVPILGNQVFDKLFEPGEYEIRILLDANKNGIWDTGDYFTRKQPERTLSIPQKIVVRPNYDNEFELNMNGTDK